MTSTLSSKAVATRRLDQFIEVSSGQRRAYPLKRLQILRAEPLVAVLQQVQVRI